MLLDLDGITRRLFSLFIGWRLFRLRISRRLLYLRTARGLVHLWITYRLLNNLVLLLQSLLLFEWFRLIFYNWLRFVIFVLYWRCILFFGLNFAATRFDCRISCLIVGVIDLTLHCPVLDAGLQLVYLITGFDQGLEQRLSLRLSIRTWFVF